MNNDELKNKIVEILFPVLKGKRVSCNEENACERCWFPCEVDRLADSLADALIAAGIGDVKKLQFDNEVLKMKNFFLEGAERSTEEDRQVWISKWEEAEHRAARAERALKDVCTNVIKDEEDDLAVEPRARVLYKAYLKQAEKELAEEEKDD